VLLAGSEAAGDRRLRFGFGEPDGERRVEQVEIGLLQGAVAGGDELAEPEGGAVEVSLRVPGCVGVGGCAAATSASSARSPAVK
jgi:hypothetical protein